MKAEHIDQLIDINRCTGISLIDLIYTYSNLQTRYVSRDLKNKKHHCYYLNAASQGERAIKVMTAYACKNHNYTENWIE